MRGRRTNTDRTDWPLLIGLAASAAAHAGIALLSARLAGEASPRSAATPSAHIAFEPAALTPTDPPESPPVALPPPPAPPPEPPAPEQPAPKPPEVTLGIDESDAVTATWIGVAPSEAGESSGRRTSVDQAAFAMPSGAPEPIPGSPGSPGAPDTSPAAQPPPPAPPPAPAREDILPPDPNSKQPPAAPAQAEPRASDSAPNASKELDSAGDADATRRTPAPPAPPQPDQAQAATTDAASLTPTDTAKPDAATPQPSREGADRPDRPDEPADTPATPTAPTNTPIAPDARDRDPAPYDAPTAPAAMPLRDKPGDDPERADAKPAAAPPRSPDAQRDEPMEEPRAADGSQAASTPEQTPPDAPSAEPALEQAAPSIPSTPSPAVAPVPAGLVPDSNPGQLADRESEATTTREVIRAQPGRPVAAKGIQIRTVRPRFSNYILVTAAPRDAVVLVSFGRDGRVINVELLRSSGVSDVDRPVIDAVYNWTAAGDKIRALPERKPPEPPATVDLKFQIVLR